MTNTQLADYMCVYVKATAQLVSHGSDTTTMKKGQ